MYNKRKKKGYYSCTNVESLNTIVSSSMSYIADIVGVSMDTMRRRIGRKNSIRIGDYIVCRNVEIHTIKRGFAIKRKKESWI